MIYQKLLRELIVIISTLIFLTNSAPIEDSPTEVSLTKESPVEITTQNNENQDLKTAETFIWAGIGTPYWWGLRENYSPYWWGWNGWNGWNRPTWWGGYGWSW